MKIFEGPSPALWNIWRIQTPRFAKQPSGHFQRLRRTVRATICHSLIYSTTIAAKTPEEIPNAILGIVECLNDPQLLVRQAATDAVASLVHGLDYHVFLI